MRGLMLAAALMAAPASAETLVAAATVRSQTVLDSRHVAVVDEDVPGALTTPEEAIGMEARVVLYAGRPIRAADVGPPALVDRNQIVPLLYHRGGLAIRTDGRALDRAAAGEAVRALNLASRSTVTGVLDDRGRIHVGARPGDREDW
ncbi:MAG: flagellar basal body P-ring formation protein FlgA [Deinococcus-Thermus bacterium]|jgi:flagella basal body P-ring formation protein FlgA|nr:flagellar basal body P-ring formation protein FlgA [Deinococcota bacterium]